MSIKLALAVISAKVAAFISQRFGWKGSSLPGVVARKIYKGTLKDLAGQARQGIIMVTGTNGKTTTNNMIANIVKSGGFRVVINQEGANLITGVTAAFIKYADMFGRMNYDYALLEVDEASFPRVVKEVKPNIVVVNNFFRDQLDRYGELDKTVHLVRDSLKGLSGVHLVLNTDDPLVAQMQQVTGHSASFFGLAPNQRPETGAKQTRESRFCPLCGDELQYESYQYSQLGSYSCMECGFKRQKPQVEAANIESLSASLRCNVFYPEGKTQIVINTQGFYNIYNALAAFSVGILLGIELEKIIQGLEEYKPAIGRMETFNYNGKPAFLNLVKNPTGFNEGINTLLSINGTKNVFIAINDNDADGRDISWLWDVDFELLGVAHKDIERFICSGLRGQEMALRLKYAGVPIDKIKIINSMEEAIKEALEGLSENTYLFSTYTALWPAQKILLSMAGKEDLHDQSLSSVS